MRSPEVCPNCGADVPRNAKSCPECGSDESTGWSDETHDASRRGIMVQLAKIRMRTDFPIERRIAAGDELASDLRIKRDCRQRDDDAGPQLIEVLDDAEAVFVPHCSDGCSHDHVPSLVPPPATTVRGVPTRSPGG